jgi:hypothetical protein
MFNIQNGDIFLHGVQHRLFNSSAMEEMNIFPEFKMRLRGRNLLGKFRF